MTLTMPPPTPQSTSARTHRTLIALISLLALVVTAALTATPVSAANLIESETNDSTASANTLPLGDTMTGKTSGSGYNDHDYFYIPISKPGRLHIELKFPQHLSGQAYDVKVYDASHALRFSKDLIGADAAGDWASDYAIYMTGGAYVSIYATSGRPVWGHNYTLRVTSVPGLVESEFNESTSSATTLPLSATIQGSTLSSGYNDHDYYFVPISRPGRVNIDLKFPTGLAGQAYDVQVLDARGDARFGRSLNGSDASGAWARTVSLYTTGSIYIRIYSPNSRPVWGKPYTLRVTSTPTNVEAEPNNSMNQATGLPLGATIYGSTMSTGYNDYDYYYTPISKAKRVSFVLRYPKTSGAAYSVAILDVNGRELYRRDLTGAQANGNWAQKIAVKAPRGGVYIRISASTSSPMWEKGYSLRVGYAFAKKPQPRIKGKLRTGKKLKVKPGKWKPKSAKLKYQWLRNGKAIKKATKAKYKVTKKDRKKKISVRVKATAKNYVTVTKKSKAVRISR